jgi:hypothetical protein
MGMVLPEVAKTMDSTELPAKRSRLFHGRVTLLISLCLLFQLVSYPGYGGLEPTTDPVWIFVMWVGVFIAFVAGIFQILTANSALPGVSLPPDACQAGETVNATLMFHGDQLKIPKIRVQVRLLQKESGRHLCLQKPDEINDQDANTTYEETIASFSGVPGNPVTITFSIPRIARSSGIHPVFFNSWQEVTWVLEVRTGGFWPFWHTETFEFPVTGMNDRYTKTSPDDSRA